MRRNTTPPASLSFMVATLPGWPDVSLLRAAARAGATAVLNLEAVSAAEARTCFLALDAPKPGRIGIRLDTVHALDALADLVDRADVVVLASGALAETVELLDRLRGAEVQLALECTTADEARVGDELGAGALIAKGNESGGRVGDETTFVLVQHIVEKTDLPVFAQGGIGRHTIGACFAAGCTGVVLDAQLALVRESSLPAAVKSALKRMEGDETVCLGSELDDAYRVYSRPGFKAVDDLRSLEEELATTLSKEPDARLRWHDAIRTRVNWTGLGAPLWPLGQDASLAQPLAHRFRSVSGVLSGLSEALATHVAAARQLRPLDRQAPLAASHGTDYPILQGPMTRVSDVGGFAAAVADAGGLPFLALALLREPAVRSLLTTTKELLGDHPWGVGILGFVPPELREEQLRVIEEFKPPFALIAGGRPDQAVTLEAQGTATYLHVPAPALLQMFVDDGARRFVFEGRECGGHVGPRTSFVLWERMIDTLLDAVERGVPANELHVVFAGGIHDARSAAMVATIGAPLAQCGARIGVLMGTAYLFTEECVSTGAIVEGFQEEMVRCSRTMLLESGPGHATRCADTPFVDLFRETRRQLVAEGEDLENVRTALERLNLGRLRIASKGVARSTTDGAQSPSHVRVDKDAQRADGMFMVGQLAALRHATCRIADLHHAVSVDGSAWLDDTTVTSVAAPASSPTTALASNVAIVGIGCLLPKATDPRQLWARIIAKADAIEEIPRERFDASRYFDTDRRARDKIYSKWGGFLDEIPFNPLKYGIPPSAMPSIDPFQLLTLEVVDQALQDAGYDEHPFDRERTSVILGASGGVGDLGFRYGIRAGLPMYLDTVPSDVLDRLPEWTEDSFAGVLLNVAAGRVANRFDFGGLNFTVDAACASSLASIYMAARELEAGTSDLVIAGGIDTVNSPFGYLCFSSAQALSPTGRCRTFDDTADGIVISEGLVALVLKRVADAERDGDRIYAVIRAVAGSSDGRGKAMTAPKPEGQMRVLQRAYHAAGFSPSTVGLVEAHGTGTVAGDAAEVTALSRVFRAAGTAPESCALGSIKSMIGHTKAAAGVSGLLKVALALHRKVLPPTLNVTKPNAKLRDDDTPFFVNTEPRPWVASPDPDEPRRAAVSSFGFGGTNFHVVVEEYERNQPGALADTAPIETWPAEVAFWTSSSPSELLTSLRRLETQLTPASNVPLRNIAATICRATQRSPRGDTRLAVVATSTADLREKLSTVCQALQSGATELSRTEGIYLSSASLSVGQIAFLFPGQGSQYPNMHRDLAVHFTEVRHALETADRATAGQLPRRLSSYVFPPPAFTDDRVAHQLRELTDTIVAQPALGAVEIGVFNLLWRLGIRPDMTAGHSYGEYVALSAGGAFPSDVLFALSVARGQAIRKAIGDHPGTMAVVSASPDEIAQAGRPPDVWIANVNSPRQTVLAGHVDAIESAVNTLTEAGLTVRRIPVACAFHSPLVQAAGEEMAAILESTTIQSPDIPVFSNSLAEPYPEDPQAIRRILADHITAPVRFADQIEAMAQSGARIFVEVGPRTVLSNLSRDTLGASGPLIVSVDAPERHGVTQLLHVVGRLAVAGVPIDFEELWRGRHVESIRLETLASADELPQHLWLVSGGRARRQAAASSDPLPLDPPRPTSTPVEPGRPMTEGSMPNATPDFREPQEHFMNSDPTNSRVQLTTDGSDDIMRQFQQLMSQFLHAQTQVMTAYLQGTSATSPTEASAPAAPPEPMPTPLSSPPALMEAAPVAATPDVARSMEAPVPPVAQEMMPPSVAPTPVSDVKPPAATAQVEPVTSVTEAGVLSQLIEIVSDRTGYPPDMLDPDANIEADLGIDSIKRMEILTAFHQTHAGAQRGALQGALEKLTAMKTLRETASVLCGILTGQTEEVTA